MDKFSSAIILAGGKSSRMGFDKQFIKVDEKTILDITASKLENIFKEIIIITNKPEEYKESNYKIATDIIKEKGPLSGIHAGLKICSSQYAFVIACDMPNVNLEYIRYMQKIITDTNKKACVTKCGKWLETLNSFYSKDMIVDIEEYLKTGEGSINRFLKSLDIAYIEEQKAKEFSPDWNMFMNLNTQDDLNIYLKNIVR